MRRFSTTAAALMAATLWVELPALAQENAAPTGSPAAATTSTEVQSSDVPEQGVLDLSLAEAIRLGIANNLDVEIRHYSPMLAEQDVVAAMGSYDPTAYGEVGYQDNNTPNSFELNQTNINIDRGLDGFAGLRGLVPFLGSNYDLRFSSAKTWTNSGVQTYSPQYQPSFRLSFKQPLLKNLIWNQPWTQVKTTKLSHESSMENFRRDVMDIVQGMVSSYWDLIAAQEQRRVDAKSLETTRALLKQTETQFEVGVVSKVEVVEAEAGVAEREFNLIQSSNAADNQEDSLIDLIYGTQLHADTDVSVAPTERPEDYVLFEASVPDSVKMAFDLRPELSAARQEIERQEIQLKYAKNQWLPEFNAEVSYGNRGIGGYCNKDLAFGTCGPAQERSYSDSFENFDQTHEVSVRGVLSYPIGNRVAKAGVSKTQISLRRAKTQLKREEQSIILAVRKAVRALKSAQEGIDAAERRRVAAAEQLRAEKIRLEYGESTPFNVLQRERDLVDAESEKISALRVYRNATAALDREQGTILRSHNIAIADVANMR
ncbi:TolC family protein [Myxococcota bacterium]|nr:TolC family protein [Myxococcota bacterium]